MPKPEQFAMIQWVACLESNSTLPCEPFDEKLRLSTAGQSNLPNLRTSFRTRVLKLGVAVALARLRASCTIIL